MAEKIFGKSLIFLISQPRAGSTLLQRMLGSHPDVHTISEPWLMLHPLYALRSKGYEAEYGAFGARSALQTFLQGLPKGEDEYIEGVRRMYSYLYERALADSGRRYLLDKTPRYYFIIPDLYRTFPEAHYIILLRNPLAVLSSVLRTWVGEDWPRLYHYKHDLVRAPRLLLESLEYLGEQGTVVHYESLVRNPEGEMGRICHRLNLNFAPEMIAYGNHGLPQWHFGDQGEVYERDRPVGENAEKWVQALDDPLKWRLTKDYLHLLGRETVEQMGYTYEALRQIQETNRPAPRKLWLTFSLDWLLKEPTEERPMWERGFVRMVSSLRQRGFRGTLGSAIRKVGRVIISSSIGSVKFFVLILKRVEKRVFLL